MQEGQQVDSARHSSPERHEFETVIILETSKCSDMKQHLGKVLNETENQRLLQRGGRCELRSEAGQR